MRRLFTRAPWIVAAVVVAALGSPAGHAQTPARIAPAVYGNLHWRFIGPEGNRFSTAAGASFEGFLDAAVLRVPGAIFADSFESSDSTAWTATVP